MAKDRPRLKPGRRKDQAGRGKNHATGKRRSEYDRKKAAQAKARAQANIAARRRYNRKVREYWLGERDEHPDKLRLAA
jgi:hypothetical protein